MARRWSFVTLDVFKLLFQFREAITDLAAIEFQVGLARAGALLPPATSRRFPHPRRDVLQPRQFNLKLRFAAVRMPMEDLHDHAGSIEHLRAGCALDVAGLARRDIMIEDDEFRLRRRVRIVSRSRGIRLVLATALKAFAGLRLPRRRHRSDDARPAGKCREVLKPPFAKHRCAVDPVALLRHGAGNLVAERLHQTAQLLEACGMRDVVDIRGLDADEDRAWNGRSSFHDTALAGGTIPFRPCEISPVRAGRRTGCSTAGPIVLRGLADRIHFASPRRNSAAAFMDCSGLNGKAAPSGQTRRLWIAIWAFAARLRHGRERQRLK